MSSVEIIKVTKKALRILGDIEVSHRWDCQVDDHAFIASDMAELLRKAKTENNLRKIARKIDRYDFCCETDSHSDTMYSISELLRDALNKDTEEDSVIDPTIKHYIEHGSEKRPKARKANPIVKGKSRKCCKFCIKISKDIVVHSDCCKGKPHGHFSGLNVDNRRGPTKLSEANFLDNRNGYGEQCPIGTVITARYLVKKLKISQTV